jgi:hypothetical protein
VRIKAVTREVSAGGLFLMASSDTKLQEPTTPASPSPATHDAYRVKSIATRLTEAELGEIEAAACKAGKKVSEWLRDTALAHVRAPQEERTDAVLLSEIMGMRSLMLNLFAKASQGPLSAEDLRKMSAYADSIKKQKVREFLAQKQSQSPNK